MIAACRGRIILLMTPSTNCAAGGNPLPCLPATATRHRTKGWRAPRSEISGTCPITRSSTEPGAAYQGKREETRNGTAAKWLSNRRGAGMAYMDVTCALFHTPTSLPQQQRQPPGERRSCSMRVTMWSCLRMHSTRNALPCIPYSMSHAVNSDVLNGGGKRERQQLLWKTFFLDHTRWWDNRRQRRNPRSPDFRHKDSGEVLWVYDCYKPAWVDSQLAVLDARANSGEFAPADSLSPNHADQLVGTGYENRLAPEFVKKLCKQGQIKEAVDALEILVATSSVIDKYLLYYVLKECVAKKHLVLGGQVHALASKMGFGSDAFLSTLFIRMYAAHGKLREAMDVFRGVALPDAFMWSSMITAYAKHGQAEQAIELYQQMRATGARPDNYVFVAALQACAAAADLRSGRQLHSHIEQHSSEPDVAVGGSLVNMYAKCGSLTDARIVFDGLLEKNVVTWNAMIAGYARQEAMGQHALNLYNAMRNECMTAPNRVTFVCLLQACANMGVSALEKGKQLHLEIKEHGLESDVAVGSSLVNMYAKCRSLTDAKIVFDGLREKDVVTWTAMIAGYAQQDGMGQNALSLFSAMQNEGRFVPNAVTFVCLLQACANIGGSALKKGQQLHSQIKESGLESDVTLGGSLVNMYAKCGSLMDATIVFDGLREKNVVTWNTMIAGYAQQEGMGQDALSLYRTMHNEGRLIPNAVTFVCLLQACANMGVSALEKGKQLHSEIKMRGLESDIAVGGSLVNMYAKCGNLSEGRVVFDGLREKNVVTWTAMISAYAQHEGMGQHALRLYSAMRNDGIAVPNAATYVCLLQACACVGALQYGTQLHSEVREEGLESDALIGTCLVNMYAQCGRLEIARQVFDRLAIKSVKTWSALIKGYAENGEGGMAIQCFEELLEQGIQPDEVTYICLLTACSRAGLVDEGQGYFDTMEERHGVKPAEWHYNCMVDLLGRSGHLQRAEQMLQAPCLAGSVVSWTALLSACTSYGDADLGRRCFVHLVNLQPTVATAYVLLGSIYANAGRWDEVERVEVLRKTAGARKKAAIACIEVKKEVHKFTVGEERSDVALTLRKMNTRVKEGGHVPQTQLVLRAVSDQEKEDALCGHAEKLALAYGLLNTPAGYTLVVTKNLRMCNDCHSSTKVMSQVEKREIVVRDGHKVHRFQNGACSCQDKP